MIEETNLSEIAILRKKHSHYLHLQNVFGTLFLVFAVVIVVARLADAPLLLMLISVAGFFLSLFLGLYYVLKSDSAEYDLRKTVNRTFFEIFHKIQAS